MRSSSLPSRNCWRSFSRVREPSSPPGRVGIDATDRLSAAGFGGDAARRRRQQQVEQALLGVEFGFVGNVLQLLFAHHVDGDLHQIADHRFDVAAHVADLGKLGGFHFQKRRVGQLGQAARDFGFAHAGGPDHDDVLGHDLFGQFGRQLLAAHAVAQGDGDGALGVVLADDVLVEFARRFRAASAHRARACSSSAVAGR